MNFYNDYAAQAKQYAIFPLERSLEYAALGLVGEVGELIDGMLSNPVWSGEVMAHIMAEAGDVWWYAAALADAHNTPFSSVADMGFSTPRFYDAPRLCGSLAAQAGKIAGATKKAIRDDGGVFTSERRVKLLVALTDLCSDMKQLDRFLDEGHVSIMSANLNKLESRKRRSVLSGDGDQR